VRTFSEFEKKIIRVMCDISDDDPQAVTLLNCFERFLAEGTIINIFAKDNLTLSLSKHLKKLYKADDIAIIQSISITLLLNHLESSKLIFLYSETDTKKIGINPIDLGGDKAEHTTVDFLPDEIKADFYKFSKKVFYVTEDLKQLVKNNFKTPEEIRLEKQLNEAQKQHDKQLEVNETLHKEQLEATKTLHKEQLKATDTLHAEQLEATKRQHKKDMNNAKKQLWLSLFSVVISIIAVVAAVLVPKYITNDINITNKELSEFTQRNRLAENNKRTLQSLISNQQETEKNLSDITTRLKELAEPTQDYQSEKQAKQ